MLGGNAQGELGAPRQDELLAEFGIGAFPAVLRSGQVDRVHPEVRVLRQVR